MVKTLQTDVMFPAEGYPAEAALSLFFNNALPMCYSLLSSHSIHPVAFYHVSGADHTTNAWEEKDGLLRRLRSSDN